MKRASRKSNKRKRSPGPSSRYRGAGAYEKVTNSLINGSGDPTLAKIVSAGNETGDIVFAHSEYIGNVLVNYVGSATTSAFQQQQYAINPGLPASFPFLSQIASAFQLYKFEGLIYTYKPLSGEGAGGSNALGKVVIATSYDPELPSIQGQNGPFSSAIQMETSEYATAHKPSVVQHQGIETANSQSAINMMYVRTGETSRSKLFTDTATLVVATEGVPRQTTTANETLIVGELWVSYKIRLSRALLFESLLNNSTKFDYYSATISASAPFAAAAIRAKSANSIIDPRAANTIIPVNGGFTSPSVNQFVYNFPVSISTGCYSLELLIGSADGTTNVAWSTQVGVLPISNCSLLTNPPDVGIVTALYNTYLSPIPAAPGCPIMSARCLILINAPGTTQATFRFVFPTGVTAGHKWQLIVTSLPYSGATSTAGTIVTA